MCSASVVGSLSDIENYIDHACETVSITTNILVYNLIS